MIIFASKEELSERLAICASCPAFDSKLVRCKKCKCYLKAKARFAIAKCPLDKWSK